jgi:hypothetical protein
MEELMRSYLSAVSVMSLILFASVCQAQEKKAERTATTVVAVTLKSFDAKKPKELAVELQNKSGKEVKHVRGSLMFTDAAGKVLFTTGFTADTGKWAADAKFEQKPLAFFNAPAELVAAMEKDSSKVTITLKTDLLKYTDGTEEKFEAKK